MISRYGRGAAFPRSLGGGNHAHHRPSSCLGDLLTSHPPPGLWPGGFGRTNRTRNRCLSPGCATRPPRRGREHAVERHGMATHGSCSASSSLGQVLVPIAFLWYTCPNRRLAPIHLPALRRRGIGSIPRRTGHVEWLSAALFSASRS